MGARADRRRSVRARHRNGIPSCRCGTEIVADDVMRGSGVQTVGSCPPGRGAPRPALGAAWWRWLNGWLNQRHHAGATVSDTAPGNRRHAGAGLGAVTRRRACRAAPCAPSCSCVLQRAQKARQHGDGGGLDVMQQKDVLGRFCPAGATAGSGNPIGACGGASRQPGGLVLIVTMPCAPRTPRTRPRCGEAGGTAPRRGVAAVLRQDPSTMVKLSTVLLLFSKLLLGKISGWATPRAAIEWGWRRPRAARRDRSLPMPDDRRSRLDASRAACSARGGWSGQRPSSKVRIIFGVVRPFPWH